VEAREATEGAGARDCTEILDWIIGWEFPFLSLARVDE
jgi:hypothetical protein